MGCSNSPRCGKGVRESAPRVEENYNLAWEDPLVILRGARKCPTCSSRIKLATRPTAHWRCVANGHLWRSH